MSTSYRLNESIKRLWEGSQNKYPIIYRPSNNGNYTYETGLFRKYISCDTRGLKVIVPIILRPYVDDAVHRLRNTSDLGVVASSLDTEIVHPIIVDRINYPKRTADSIIRGFFENDTEYKTLINVETNKGAKYSGGRGIILDEEERVLFLATIVGNYQFEDGEVKLVYTENRIYIHPKVILDTSDLICKAIMKKIIPFFLETKLNSYHFSNIYVSGNITNTVVVDDVGWMFTTPTVPPPDFRDEDVNEFLQERANDVIEASWL